MKALGLNEKGNKGKEKAVEEKEESGMKTALNVFEKSGSMRRHAKGRFGFQEDICTSSADEQHRPSTCYHYTTQSILSSH
jgi:hypothetical protein